MLRFDFDEMMALHQRSPEVFEQRRIELINDTINRCSGHQREALVKLQYELDQIRSKQPEHFMRVLFEGMGKNLKDLSSAWKDLAVGAERLTADPTLDAVS